MNPVELLRWEDVLRSQFAISLLLLAALIAMISWCLMLYRENQRLNQEFREHLRIQGDFSAVIDNARQAIALVHENYASEIGAQDHSAD